MPRTKSKMCDTYTTSASEADEGDGAGGDGGTGFDLFGPDPTPMEDL